MMKDVDLPIGTHPDVPRESYVVILEGGINFTLPIDNTLVDAILDAQEKLRPRSILFHPDDFETVRVSLLNHPKSCLSAVYGSLKLPQYQEPGARAELFTRAAFAHKEMAEWEPAAAAMLEAGSLLETIKRNPALSYIAAADYLHQANDSTAAIMIAEDVLERGFPLSDANRVLCYLVLAQSHFALDHHVAAASYAGRALQNDEIHKEHFLSAFEIAIRSYYALLDEHNVLMATMALFDS